MNIILIGLLFTVFDIKLFFDTISFDIFPDFVGHLLMIFGFLKLSSYNLNFTYGAKVSIITSIVSVVYFILELFGTFIAMPYIHFAFDSAMFLLFALTLFFLLQGMKQIEDINDCYLGYGALNILWRIFVGIYSIVIITAFFSSLISSILLILNFVIMLTFLFLFFRSNKLFKEIIT